MKYISTIKKKRELGRLTSEQSLVDFLQQALFNFMAAMTRNSNLVPCYGRSPFVVLGTMLSE